MSKDIIDNQEDFTLKKIRYYQGTIDDFTSFWNNKIKQGESEESKETKDCKNRNAELNKAFEIVPVSPDEPQEKNDCDCDKDEHKCKCKKGEKCDCGGKCKCKEHKKEK